MRNFSKFGINLLGHTTGRVKTTCPFCSDRRSHPRDKSLSVDIDSGLYKCHYCEAQGYIPDEDEERLREIRRKRRERKQQEQPRNNGFVRPEWHPNYLINDKPSSILDYLTRTRGLSLDIMQQMRLTIEYLNDKPMIGFNYFDRGLLINRKLRSLDKTFSLVAKAELIPYNIDAILTKDICYITEGEFDCITMVQAGFTECISVPNGAQKNLTWMDRFVETHFDDKTRIILALDNDQKGKILLAELTRRLGDERCRIVRWDDDCKDANEELCRHGLQRLRECVNGAEEIPLTGIQTAEDVQDQLLELFINGKKHGARLYLNGMDHLLTFETGRYMVVSGRPGDGKSEFIDELCLRLCLLHGWKVAYFSPENTPIIYHLSKLFEKLTGFPFQNRGAMTMDLFNGCKNWIRDNLCHILPGTDFDPTADEFSPELQQAIEDCADHFTLDAILEKARQAIARRGVRILVIDPLNNIEPEAGLDDLKWDRKVNFELRRFARKYHCLVILVAHPRKVNRANIDGRKRRVEMNDINGSADFGNMSDYCLCVDRDDDMQIVTIFVDKVKFKHLGSRGACHFQYDLVSGRYVPCTLERVTGEAYATLDVGTHPDPNKAKLGISIVKNSLGTKFYKKPDYRNFNLRWVNAEGEGVLADYVARFEDAEHNNQQMTIFAN